jgi:hypothetical protein
MRAYVCCCYENRKGQTGQWGSCNFCDYSVKEEVVYIDSVHV